MIQFPLMNNKFFVFAANIRCAYSMQVVKLLIYSPSPAKVVGLAVKFSVARESFFV